MDASRWERVKSIVERAAALPAAARAALLATECGGDSELRHEVDSLLRAHDAASRFLEETTSLAPADEPRPPGPDETASLGDAAGTARADVLPERIGKYRILSALGSGGQAFVFRAMHPALEKELVLKLSRGAVSAESELGRHLVNEGRVLCELDHPSIARIHDLDFHHGRPFLVLELVRGRELSVVSEDEGISESDAAVLVAKLARAVAFAHRRGVVHRDIKPDNIVIDEAGEPHLLDFGLALLRHGSSDGLESSGTVSGTIPFMAPEQARGEVERVGPRSDIFALGAVLYALRVGRGPFDVRDAEFTDGEPWERALDHARRCDFDREALARRGTSRGLARICLRALESDPADRFATAEELAVALESWESWFARPRKARVALLSMALLIGVIVLGVVGALMLRQGPLRVERFDLEHVESVGGEVGDVHLLGESSFAVSEGDWMRLIVDFNEPVHAYLVALNPDGEPQLLAPGDAHAPPGKATRWVGPPESKYFRFSDGSGLQAVVVIASRRPLPAFVEWRRAAGLERWRRHGGVKGVWRFDGEMTSRLGLPGDYRGELETLPSVVAPFTEVCDHVAGLEGLELIEARAFAVLAE